MTQTLDEHIVEVNRLTEDRRDTRRMPQPGGYGTAQIRIGKKVFAVTVLDESAGGFMVEADKIPRRAAPGMPAELINGAGPHSLLIVWRRMADGQTRLGLQRLGGYQTLRPESSQLMWLLAAIVLGFGVGYIFAFHDRDDLVNRIVELSQRRTVVNQHVDTPAAPAPVEKQ